MTAQATALPPAVQANPRLGDWLRIAADGFVEVRTGKVELGQGAVTALAQVAAEELDVDLARVRMVPAAAPTSPDEGFTAGSMSVQYSGVALRVVCAEARAIYLAVAAERLGVEPGACVVRDGVITAEGGLSTSYWALADDALLDRAATGCAPAKPSEQYRIIGANVPRLDLPDKLTGRPRYVHDLAPDRMLYGRVVRPPSRGATLLTVDTTRALGMAGVVALVRDGEFLGVVADREEVALRAADQLRADVDWKNEPTLPDEDDLPAFLTSQPVETTVLAEQGEPAPADQIAHTYTATYHRPYLAHASMGPSCATALVTEPADEAARIEVWTHSQGVYPLRRELARALRVPDARITVRHAEGAGCYGHNGADDVALDAVLLARAVPGRPVQVVWSRPDELGWAPFGTAAVVELRADVDAEGAVLNWRHEIWGSGHSTRPGSVESVSLLAASHRTHGEPIDPAADPPLAMGGGAGRNSVPSYGFPHFRVVNHRLLTMPLRVSALRSLGAFANVFAAESFLDELALAAGCDPVEYRRGVLTDPRSRAVVEAVAKRARWRDWRPGESVGHGIGFARYKNTSGYCAVIAEVEAEHEVRVRRLTMAVDAGIVVNPDGAINQIEGGAIQATSWALKERVRFDRFGVTSDTWASYPILRFSEVPPVDVELLPGNGNPSLGVGEVAQGPTVAAIANAVHDALGVRVRTLPLTPEQIVAAMV